MVMQECAPHLIHKEASESHPDMTPDRKLACWSQGETGNAAHADGSVVTRTAGK